jgi:hypothetical protein
MNRKAIRALTVSSIALILALPAISYAEGRHFHNSGVHTAVVPGYYTAGPYWNGWGGWGDPFWGYGWGPYYYPIDNGGKIKIRGADKYDQVYVNGAYAGTIEKMKNIRLDPGTYDIEVRRNGQQLVNRSVYVITGKTIEINVGNELARG